MNTTTLTATDALARTAGILLHPTSLPGPGAGGDLGPAAYRFVDWLAAAGQRIWQILPLNPPGYGGSPYASVSAFASDTRLISLDLLHDDGLLTAEELTSAPPAEDAAATRWKDALLRRACARLLAGENAALREHFTRYCAEEAAWLEDYALFRALRAAHDDAPWTTWEAPLRRRDPGALAQARGDLADEVATHQALQFLFDRQWQALRQACHERGVRILGDLPIFVAHDSADVWAHQHLFALDTEGNPTVVAGVPPDYFSPTGQRWGNPLYRWDVLAGEGYAWWIDRFRATLRRVDFVRIDHFRGFESYWEIPASEPTAERGRWVQGPGMAFFEAVWQALGDLPLVAEDLGTITPEVDRLRRAAGLPGMRVLQFAFGSDARNPHLPHNYAQDIIVYTGTHDNDTTAGWYATLDDSTRRYLHAYLGRGVDDIVRELIRLAYSSVACLAIVPMQDVLGLGSEARMNLPGRAEQNWTWRLPADGLREEDAAWLASLARTYGR